jgi:hypothetical protein
MSLSHPVPHIDKVQVSINLHNVDWTVIAESSDAWDVDCVIATKHDGQRAALQDPTYGRFGIGVAPDRIGVNDVSVTYVNDAHFVQWQVDCVILVIVGSPMAEREQR